MLRVKQTCSILSTYTADVSGVASALYEMGGMTVMHDASGCNSTYNTHDEPRWYDMPSMIFISALAEVDALMGDDEKVVADVCRTAQELSPRFIALAGTPIPMMMGTDFRALSRMIEERTGIPTFGFATNGMNSYNRGAGIALAAVAERFCRPAAKKAGGQGGKPSVNLLGVTPLDFSVTGNVEALKKLFNDAGYPVVSCWAMGSSWEELMRAPEAEVNITVSSCGEALARVLRDRFGIPSVTGLPVGRKLTEELFALTEKAAAEGKDFMLSGPSPCEKPEVWAVGEAVQSAAIAAALEKDFGIKKAASLSPLDFPDEDLVFESLRGASLVVADPLYRPAVREAGCRFIELPHEGYSGRIFRDKIPVFIGENLDKWMEGELSK